jgi:large subunit ribosomal protein L3
MKFILGTKQYMTQVFDADGRALPATVIVAGPVRVTQVRTKERDGYEAVQYGFGTTKEHRVNKAIQGHQKASGGLVRHLREVRSKGDVQVTVGDQFSVGDLFAPGDIVAVSATSKGKGFQGVVKRHGFAGGPRSHGQKHSEREPGSIGAGGVQKVLKGTRMAGRMGGDRVTVKNLKVLHIDADGHRLILSGAVPGRRGTFVEIRGE